MIDVSGSMVQKGNVEAAKKAVLPLSETHFLRADSHYAHFVQRRTGAAGRSFGPASDTAGIRKALDELKPGGGTNPVSAFTWRMQRSEKK